MGGLGDLLLGQGGLGALGQEIKQAIVGKAQAGGADPLIGQLKAVGQQADAAFKGADAKADASAKQAQAQSDADQTQAQAAVKAAEKISDAATAHETAQTGAYFAFADSIGKSLAKESQQIQGILVKSFDGMIKKMVAGNFNLTDAFKGLAKSVGSSMLGSIAAGLMAHGIEKTTEGTSQAAKGLQGGDQLMATGAAMMAASVGIKDLSKAYLAQGGLVSRPTLALIGEGGQSEAVIPLDRLKGGQALTQGKQVPELTMTFHGVRGLADVANGKLRKQATAHFRAVLAGKHQGERRYGRPRPQSWSRPRQGALSGRQAVDAALGRRPATLCDTGGCTQY
jgi:SLT domain-containing protein